MPPMSFTALRSRACGIKRDVHAIYLAARDPRTPWHAKALAFVRLRSPLPARSPETAPFTEAIGGSVALPHP